MKHRARRIFLYYGLFLLRLFILCLPRVAYLQIAKWAGYVVYRVLRKEREKTERHLKFAFGSEKSEEEISRISRGVFENLGQNLAEWISSGKYNPSNISSFVETDGLEKIRTVLARGSSIISMRISNLNTSSAISLFVNNFSLSNMRTMKR